MEALLVYLSVFDAREIVLNVPSNKWLLLTRTFSPKGVSLHNSLC